MRNLILCMMLVTIAVASCKINHKTQDSSKENKITSKDTIIINDNFVKMDTDFSIDSTTYNILELEKENADTLYYAFADSIRISLTASFTTGKVWKITKEAPELKLYRKYFNRERIGDKNMDLQHDQERV